VDKDKKTDEEIIDLILSGKSEAKTVTELTELMNLHVASLIDAMKEYGENILKENKDLNITSAYIYWLLRRIARLEVNQAFVVRHLVVSNQTKDAEKIFSHIPTMTKH
jgi:hypothetical protein